MSRVAGFNPLTRGLSACVRRASELMHEMAFSLCNSRQSVIL